MHLNNNTTIINAKLNNNNTNRLQLYKKIMQKIALINLSFLHTM
jgi:hypothetical protein